MAEKASTPHCICKVLITPDELDCLPLSLHALATLIFRAGPTGLVTWKLTCIALQGAQVCE